MHITTTDSPPVCIGRHALQTRNVVDHNRKINRNWQSTVDSIDAVSHRTVRVVAVTAPAAVVRLIGYARRCSVGRVAHDSSGVYFVWWPVDCVVFAWGDCTVARNAHRFHALIPYLCAEQIRRVWIAKCDMANYYRWGVEFFTNW